jgi:hypothetical protein
MDDKIAKRHSRVANDSPSPPPRERGRIAGGAFANPERLGSSPRGMRRPLSLRERVRVRGNQMPPTKTAGRILQAQPDWLPELMACGAKKKFPATF